MAQQSNTQEPEDFAPPKNLYNRLEQLCSRSGYSLSQRNGQRYYGPPPNWIGGPPEKGSEVFIGRLPRDCFEDELLPVFESVAPLYEARMMLNFSGYNRCYAFVTYRNAHDAEKAILLLHNYEIRPGRKIAVTKSIEKCRLYIGGIPLHLTKADAWNMLVKICPGIKHLIMYPDPTKRKQNRGFLFVEFESHYPAALAKRSLLNKFEKVVVDWAIPEPYVNPIIMDNITKLFIRNVPPTFSTKRIRLMLQDTIPINSIQRVYLSGYYCFLHFDNRAHAQLAMDILSFVDIDGELLEVHWARPKGYKKERSSNSRSLPPRFQRATGSPSPDNVQPQSNDINNNNYSLVYNQPSVLYDINPTLFNRQ